MLLSRPRHSALAGLAALGLLVGNGQAQETVSHLRQTFASPPSDARPMMRWWWFGPAVVKPEIARELDQMHAAGIGGVELAAEYPMSVDDPAKGIQNLRYGSSEYVAMVRFAAEHATELGMRVDLTLGSGWPFGGPEIPIGLAAGRLKIVAVPLPSPADALPRPADGDQFIAAFVANGTPQHYDANRVERVPGSTLPTSLAKSSGAEPRVELFFFASHTRQQVKRAAFGGEGFVLDHMARLAIDTYLHSRGDALMGAFQQRPPYAIFSDSLEVYGSDWTPDLPAEFARRRGYDLVSHLPQLAQGGTPEAESVRRDWGLTLSELVRDNYLKPMMQYAAAHATRFRSQTYGEPAVTLADEHIPQLPEGEGPQWHAFSFTRWASSANHVYGNRITSAETWTWLHSPAFRATPLDMKAEADRMFLQGVNQIVGHGFPYSAPGVEEPGWSLYAAAALNAHNPWWPVMPAVTKYLQRVSWALRQGEPANDIAILLPEADAQAAFRPGHVSVTEEMKKRITPELMGAVLDHGYNLDYVDLNAIRESGGLRYPVMIVPPTQRIALTGVRVLRAYAENGGRIIFLGATPTRAAGLEDAGNSAAISGEMEPLVAKSVHVETMSELSAALARVLEPDVQLGDAGGKVGFIHRHSKTLDIYFIANTSAQATSFPVRVRAHRQHEEWWDADTGAVSRAENGETTKLEPYESRLLVLTDEDDPARAEGRKTDGGRSAIPLGGWTVSFPGSAGSKPLPTEEHVNDTMWTDNAAARFYSGEVRYSTKFVTSASAGRERLILRFGPGKELANTQSESKPGMRAWFEPPIREAAIVLVNGKEIGDLWHPPYEMDVTSAVHEGENTLELRVFNTAINELAGQPPRDYTALKAQYGDRFQMQDMDDLEPVPSGIEGPVQLVYETAAELGSEERR